MKDSQIEKQISDYAEGLGCIVYKFSSPGKRNVPDRIVITPHGIVAFLEIKKPGGEVRSGQLRECLRIQKNKVAAAIIDNVDDGKLFIDAILNS